MKAVIVSIGNRGSSEVVGTCPAAINTIIVSPTARDAPSTIAATIPESAAGKTTRVETWRRDGPDAERALTQPVRHGGHRVLGDRGDRRDDHDAHDDAAGEPVEDGDLEAEQIAEYPRGEEGEREVPEDDGRDSRQEFERGLDRPADALRCVFAQVDRRAEPERNGDDESDQRYDQRSLDQGADPELGIGEQR